MECSVLCASGTTVLLGASHKSHQHLLYCFLDREFNYVIVKISIASSFLWVRSKPDTKFFTMTKFHMTNQLASSPSPPLRTTLDDVADGGAVKMGPNQKWRWTWGEQVLLSLYFKCQYARRATTSPTCEMIYAGQLERARAKGGTSRERPTRERSSSGRNGIACNDLSQLSFNIK